MSCRWTARSTGRSTVSSPPAGIHVLTAVGDDARTMADAAQQDNPQLKVVGARDHAVTLAAHDLIRPGDIVLVKGSHSVGLEHTSVRLAQPDTMADEGRRLISGVSAPRQPTSPTSIVRTTSPGAERRPHRRPRPGR
ncbi:hypothetical protein [Streptomyces europaeiscabiei]|uniref:hypothetical protein n=1 Tax=Streptomyces europaeiscabiei TaxID=146819 RepID=UPI0029BF87E6|nr:hypothetical protein [Streptomyces europaeiscabiei]MDX2530969.1 hypothetical protein [Streptomyces europaeiscabiei]